MKCTFQHIGSLRFAQFELGDLNVVCGKNNTGKTYLTYTLWQLLARSEGLIAQWGPDDWNQVVGFDVREEHPRVNEAITENNIITEDVIAKFQARLFEAHLRELPRTFSAPDGFFSKAAIRVEFSLYVDLFFMIPLSTKGLQWEHILRNLFSGPIFYRPFILTAQRDSIELFYKEIDRNRSQLLFRQGGMMGNASLQQSLSIFPSPIQENINFARDLTSQVIKHESYLAREHPDLLREIEAMLGVTYTANELQVSVSDAQTGAALPVFMASTSVRSLLHLHFWLKHQAQKGDLLMIDEPELNLHPENQIKMARLFVKLVNVGIKVWITTHSDYIVKELNNCLMLSKNSPNREALMQAFGYTEQDVLRQEQLKAYMMAYDPAQQGNVLQEAALDEYGMVMLTFDEEIERINHVSNELANDILGMTDGQDPAI
jgi:predicted ATPase